MSVKQKLLKFMCVLIGMISLANCDAPINPVLQGQQGEQGPAGPQGEVGERGLDGATGKRGHTGRAGPDAGMVYFNMMLSAVRTFDVAFFASNANGQSASQFDTSTTNPSNKAYSTFLVPFDGTISDLTIRADVTATADTTPNFTFTVYASEATMDSAAATTGWTATALAHSTGEFTVNNGTSRTIVSQNLSDSDTVTAGTILTVVVSGTGYADFALQPAKFATSFRYTPD